MFKRYCLIALMSLTATLPGQIAVGPTSSILRSPKVDAAQHLHDLCERYYALLMETSPESATYYSYPGFDDRWSDLSPSAIAKRDYRILELLQELNSIDREQLKEIEQLNFDTFKWVLEDTKAGQRFRSEYLPFNKLDAVHFDIAEVFNIMPKKTLADYENMLIRLKTAPALIDQTIVLLRKGMVQRITTPKVALEGVTEQLLAVMPERLEECIYFNSFKSLPDTFSAADKERIQSKALEILRNGLYPALQRLYDFLVTDYIPNCRETIGFSDLDDGLDWYQQRVRHYTTTDLTPEQIHALGWSEVMRIRKEMQNVIETVKFHGTLPDFFEYMRTDPQFFYKERQDLLNGYRQILSHVEMKLPTLFGHLPKLPCIVLPIPEHSEEHAIGAYYVLGSLKTNRPGVFYANTSKLNSRPNWGMEALALHEALPGHHFQISLVLENEQLLNFRKLSTFTAYVEGWGLYSEGLGRELGLYANPYSYFGRLDAEMHRAIRLVVDTGIHAFGWSRQQAIDYFLANTGMGLHEIETEVDRYIVWPGQALAYKIGELKILEMRYLAQQELGTQFDIRAFHDEVLAHGALPLSIFEAHMKRWIAKQRRNAIPY